MARLADGDRSACAEVFQRLWPALTRFAARSLGVGPDAEDAAQQALEKIFAQASNYDPERAALPWALAITGWECRTTLRRRRRRREEALEGASGRDLTAEVGAGPTPEDDVLKQRLLVALREAVAELSLGDQATLEATFLQESAAPHPAVVRKRKERTIFRLREVWRRIYGD